jgi:hypothetical protein
MASSLSSSRLQTESNLTKLRRLLGWQSLGFDGKMRRGIAPPANLRPDEFVYFSSYALSGLVLLFSSFFFTLLESYSLQLHHLSSHYIMLVVIFIHLL